MKVGSFRWKAWAHRELGYAYRFMQDRGPFQWTLRTGRARFSRRAVFYPVFAYERRADERASRS
jgi:hypothetical protein